MEKLKNEKDDSRLISSQEIRNHRAKALRLEFIWVVICLVILFLCKSISNLLFNIVGFLLFLPLIFSAGALLYHLTRDENYWRNIIRNQSKYKAAGFIIKQLAKFFGG
ncbi:hypothetical protein [Phocaeicola barnesiae]|uniref:Transmembrane protein n=1 Tax=Phocaeicola barnesiae TaxID=376804 RepID=A0AAW5N5Y2_9BACT|nr:hypothetical protein [Phocaeicola barnesiae]MCR8873188.1 hypothetical protein [Phocaeicola barnesiae]